MWNQSTVESWTKLQSVYCVRLLNKFAKLNNEAKRRKNCICNWSRWFSIAFLLLNDWCVAAMHSYIHAIFNNWVCILYERERSGIRCANMVSKYVQNAIGRNAKNKMKPNQIEWWWNYTKLIQTHNKSEWRKHQQSKAMQRNDMIHINIYGDAVLHWLLFAMQQHQNGYIIILKAILIQHNNLHINSIDSLMATSSYKH